MPKKVVTKTNTAVSVRQVAGLTGMMLMASAAIAAILTFFVAVK